MPGRKFSGSNNYIYGFNGKENDKETVSTGDGTQDYGFRIYNPALGRFLSVDPLSKEYPWYTPYQFAGNKPIWAIDLDGLEEYFVTERLGKNGYTRIYEKNPDLKARAKDVGKFQFKENGKAVGEIMSMTQQNYDDLKQINKSGNVWESAIITTNKPLIRPTNEKEVKDKPNRPTSEKKVEDKIKDKEPSDNTEKEETKTIKYVVLDILVNRDELENFSKEGVLQNYVKGATEYWKSKGYDEVKFRKVVPITENVDTNSSNNNNVATDIVEEGVKQVKK